MATSTISPKVAASGAAGAVVALAVWVLHLFGVEVPTEIQAAALVVLPTLAGYLTRDRLRDLGAIIHRDNTVTAVPDLADSADRKADAALYDPKHSADTTGDGPSTEA